MYNQLYALQMASNKTEFVRFLIDAMQTHIFSGCVPEYVRYDDFDGKLKQWDEGHRYIKALSARNHERRAPSLQILLVALKHIESIVTERWTQKQQKHFPAKFPNSPFLKWE